MPELSESRFFWRHAFAGRVLYVQASDVTDYLRQWADKAAKIEGGATAEDLRRTADELDVEWMGFIPPRCPSVFHARPGAAPAQCVRHEGHSSEHVGDNGTEEFSW